MQQQVGQVPLRRSNSAHFSHPMIFHLGSVLGGILVSRQQVACFSHPVLVFRPIVANTSMKLCPGNFWINKLLKAIESPPPRASFLAKLLRRFSGVNLSQSGFNSTI